MIGIRRPGTGTPAVVSCLISLGLLVVASGGCSLLSQGTAADTGEPSRGTDSVESESREEEAKAGAAHPGGETEAGAGRESGGEETEGGREPDTPGVAAVEATETPAPDPPPPSGPVLETDVERLRNMGPVYTPYDRGPLLLPGNWLTGLLQATLVPVIERFDLSPDTSARFWVLVTEEGRVGDVALQLTSGSQAFDDAAAAVAARLRYTPALRDGGEVPVWVLASISLLMR